MPQTLLLADDSVTIQRVIELTFADEAIKVVAVSDGDQAIERIEADPPDIVLVDIGMPGRTGYEVAQHIKQSPRLKHIPVLLLTGAFEPVDQAKAAAAGCDGVLAKPFEPQAVIARVKELLGRRGEGAVPPPAEKQTPVFQPGPSGETWGRPRAEPKRDAPPAEQLAHLDDYFDQLDAAFQKLGGSAPAEQPKRAAASSPVADIIDWFGGKPAPAEAGPDLPLSLGSPTPQRELEHTLDAPPPNVPGFMIEPAPEAPKFVSEPAAQMPPTFVTEPVPQAPAKFMEEPAAQTAPTFVTEPAPRPPTKFMEEPAPQTAPTFVTESAPRPPSKFMAEPVPQIAPAFVSEPDPETAPKFVSEPGRKMATPAHTPSTPAPLPPMADAFAAILAAERHEPPPTGIAWPPPPEAPQNGGGAPDEDVIEEITRRVLARLSDRVVRESVADAISSIAERLVRDEIERIKATIK